MREEESERGRERDREEKEERGRKLLKLFLVMKLLKIF